jgi:hypothetical protein
MVSFGEAQLAQELFDISGDGKAGAALGENEYEEEEEEEEEVSLTPQIYLRRLSSGRAMFFRASYSHVPRSNRP